MRIAAIVMLAMSVVPSQNILTLALHAAHKDKDALASDPFAATSVDDSLAGRQFEITLSFGEQLSSPSLLHKFEDGQLSLILNLDSISYKDRSALEDVKTLDIAKNVRGRGSYTGQNSYGARTLIEARTEIIDELAVFKRPDGDWFPDGTDHAFFEKNIGSDRLRDLKTAYIYNAEVPGPAAKALIADTVVVVSGSIRPVHGGKISGCFDSALEPTLDAPVNVLSRYCWVGADLTSIIFKRRSTGETLRAWLSNG